LFIAVDLFDFGTRIHEWIIACEAGCRQGGLAAMMAS